MGEMKVREKPLVEIKTPEKRNLEGDFKREREKKTTLQEKRTPAVWRRNTVQSLIRGFRGFHSREGGGQKKRESAKKVVGNGRLESSFWKVRARKGPFKKNKGGGGRLGKKGFRTSHQEWALRVGGRLAVGAI